MKVQIMRGGTYSTFVGIKRRAEKLEPGDVRDWPDVYAEGIIANGMAVLLPEIKDMEVVIAASVQEFDQAISEAMNATNGAIKLAQESGLDLSTVEGTGTDGRILLSDVRGALLAA